jgi:hypothetical protein
VNYSGDWVWISLEAKRHITPEQFQQRQDETVRRLMQVLAESKKPEAS